MAKISYTCAASKRTRLENYVYVYDKGRVAEQANEGDMTSIDHQSNLQLVTREWAAVGLDVPEENLCRNSRRSGGGDRSRKNLHPPFTLADTNSVTSHKELVLTRTATLLGCLDPCSARLRRKVDWNGPEALRPGNVHVRVTSTADEAPSLLSHLPR